MDRSLDGSVWRRLLSSQGSAREVEPIGDYVGGWRGHVHTRAYMYVCGYVHIYNILVCGYEIISSVYICVPHYSATVWAPEGRNHVWYVFRGCVKEPAYAVVGAG